MRSEEELAELTKMAQQLEEELDRWTMMELDGLDDVEKRVLRWKIVSQDKGRARSNNTPTGREGRLWFEIFCKYCAKILYIWKNELKVKPKGESSSSRGAWGLVSHEEGSGGFSLVGNILPTHLSFKTRCWKRTWRAQRTGFYWPARWCCSCFGGGMNGDGQECFRVLITSFWGEDSAGKNDDGDERLMFDLPRNWIRLRLQWTTVTGWER